MNRFGLVLLLVSFSSGAYACSCADSGPACQAFGAPYPQAVFVAHVQSIVRGSQENIVTLKVSESFHPDVHGTVTVRTASYGAACGYDFKQDQDYLIWASARNISDLQVSLCSATRPLQEAGSDLEYLRSFSSRNETSWIYGEAWQYIFDPDFKLPDTTAPGEGKRTPERDRSMKPLANVTATATDANGRTYQSVVDSEGQYKMLGLPPGKYSVRLDVPETMMVWPEQTEFDVKPGGCRHVDFRAQIDGRVSGIVTDQQGNPLPGAHVGLGDVRHIYNVERQFNTTADKEGRFELNGIPAGEYVLFANKWQSREPVLSDITYYPRASDAKAATVVKLAEAQKIKGLNIRLLPPHIPIPIDAE